MTPRPSHVRGIVLVTAGTISLVPDSTLIRLAHAGDLLVTFWRSVFLALAIAIYTVVRHRRATPRAIADLGVDGAGIAGLWAIGLGLFVFAVTHTAVANTLVIVSTSPMFAALFSRLILGETVSPRTWLAMLGAAGGVALAFAGSIQGGEMSGNVAALLAAANLGANLTLLRRGRERDMVPAASIGGAVAAVAALPWAWPIAISWHDVWVIGLMGGVCVPAGLVLITLGTRDISAPEVGLLMLLETVLGPLMAWWIVHERPPSLAALGGAVVIATLAVHSAAALTEERRLAGAQAGGDSFQRPQ